MQKTENMPRITDLGLEIKCRYCGNTYILRLSPHRCPYCGYPNGT